MKTLTKEILNECLTYLEDGRLMTKIQPRHHFNSDQAWKVSATRKAVPEEAGYIMDNGYRMIRIYYLGKCCCILSHRAVWIMHKGDIEDDLHVDHKDRVITNCRILNLRLTLRTGNTQNSKFRSTNTSGVKGVYWNKKYNCWKVQLRADKKQHHIGYYQTIEEATVAIQEARNRLHGEFANQALRS